MKTFGNRTGAGRRWWIALLCGAALLAPVSTQAAQNRWVPVNGPHQGGEVRALFIGSGGSYSGTTLIAGIHWGGVYRSTDGGSNWSAINSGLGDLRVRVLVAPASDSSTIYAPTLGGGIYVTNDAHAATPTWSKVAGNGLTCSLIRSMAMPNDASTTLYAAGCGNVYKSTNSGTDWTMLNTGANGWPADGVEAFSIRVQNNTTGNTVQVATDGAGILLTTDGGTSWTAINGPQAPAGATSLGGASPPNGLSVFNITGRAGTPDLYAYVAGAGVYRTSNCVSDPPNCAWSDFNTGLPADKKGRSLAGISSVQTTSAPVSSRLYLSIDGAGLYRSLDGAAWELRGNDFEQFAGMRSIRNESLTLPVGNTWYTWGFAGIHKSTDNGLTWNPINNGLPLGYVGNTASHASTPNTVFAAGSFLHKSTDGGQTWNRVALTGAGSLPYLMAEGNVSVDPNDANTVYVGTTSAGFWKSEDGGATWSQMIPTGGGADVTDWGRARVLAFPSATVPGQTVLYASFRNYNAAGNHGFYRGTTSDGGGTIAWSNINNGGLAMLDKRFVRHSDASDATIYASTSGGLYKSTDTGATWSFINPSGLAFETGRIETLSINPDLLYLAVNASDSMDRALPYSGVYISYDSGASWGLAGAGEKITALRLAGTGPTANLFVNSAGWVYVPNDIGASRCLQPTEENNHPDDIECQDMPALYGVRVTHFENGGESEFVVRRASSTNGVYKYIYNSLGQDFDGNGLGDILWRRNVLNNGTTYIWNLDGLAVDGTGYTNPVVTDLNWKIAAIADFNGDGHTDILWRYENLGISQDGRNIIWLMNNRVRMTYADIGNVAPSSLSDLSGRRC